MNDPNISLPPYEPSSEDTISQRASELSQQISREMGDPPPIFDPPTREEYVQLVAANSELAQRVAKIELFLGLKG